MIRVLEFPCGPAPGNFGDRLTCHVLRQQGLSCTPVRVDDPHGGRNLVGIGSVLQLCSPAFEGVIWTSGVIGPHQHATVPGAKVLAVRGQMTYERLTCQEKQGVVLGDGGLLAEADTSRKYHELGLIPHWSQCNAPEIVALAGKPGVVFINPCDEVGSVIEAIAECKYIASSSLHGLIVADALGIPSIWVNPDPAGGINTFKFWDYFSAFMRRMPSRYDILEETSVDELVAMCSFSEERRHVLAEIKQRLRVTVDSIKEHFGGKH